MDAPSRPPGSKPAFWRREVPIWFFVVIALALAALVGSMLLYGDVYGRPFDLGNVLPGAETFDYGSYPSLSNADHFNTIKQKLVADRESFIEADLSQMVLRVYKDGVSTREFKILTKGREGSWWETPAGVYRIESKEENHFSSFGHVNQPWSMAFQGNFFIHGWPTYPDGTPVSSQFSGGCIRLADEDAEAIYRMVDVGTPVLVYEKDFGTDGFAYTEPSITVSAKSYLVADLQNNFVLAEEHSKDVLPIASLTKLVTALVAAEYINLDKDIVVTEEMVVPTSKPRLHVGERVQAFQLLYPLLLESSNEAAAAYAESVGSERFVSLMNKKAAAIGMTATHFADAAGKDAENISTPEDLFVLLKYIRNNRSFVLNISTGNLTWSVYGEPTFTNLSNFNDFKVENATFLGGKSGKTIAAGNTAVAIYELEIQGTKRPIAIIVLNSEDLTKDIPELVNHVLRTYP